MVRGGQTSVERVTLAESTVGRRRPGEKVPEAAPNEVSRKLRTARTAACRNGFTARRQLVRRPFCSRQRRRTALVWGMRVSPMGATRRMSQLWSPRRTNVSIQLVR